jgi:hypothetical protein
MIHPIRESAAESLGSPTSVLLAVVRKPALYTSGWCAYTHECLVSEVPPNPLGTEDADSSSPSP